MLDLGWQEFMMVAIVLILVVGPKDMPRMLRSFSRAMRKAKSMASEFTSSLENVANEADMKQIMQDVKTGEFDDIANLIDGEVDDEGGGEEERRTCSQKNLTTPHLKGGETVQEH